ncbi:MAG: antibiotic biosynthesis monooxygenase [Arenicella sp.]
MFAREWKARCPKHKKEGFIDYLYETGVKDTSATSGFFGAQILLREFGDKVEVTLISYWASLEAIEAFAGKDISVARLYPEDDQYELEPDAFVNHYEVIENTWK